MTEANVWHTILDRDGNSYQLAGREDEDGLCCYLAGKDGPAGKLELIYNSPNEWVIANLELFAQAPKKPPNKFMWLLRELHLWKPPLIDYRGRGLGTALLNFVEERARQCQVRRITGEVIRRDYEDWSPLLDWYKRRDFTVILTLNLDRTGSGTDTIANIYKDM